MIIDPQSIQSGATYLSADLPDLVIREAGTDLVTVTIAVGNTTIYQEALQPVLATITVADIARLVTAALEGNLVDTLSVTATPVTPEGDEPTVQPLEITATVYYSRICVNQDADAFLTSHFLTVTDRRTSRIGYAELLFAFLVDDVPPEAATVTAYYADGTTASFSVEFTDLSTTAPNLVALDVSPTLFQDLDLAADLARIVVSLGSRSLTIDIDFSPAICRGHLRFVNAFGLPDVVHLLGRSVEKTSFARSAGWFSGRYRQFDAQETMEREISSGYVDNDAYALWLDCARTTDLAIFPHPNTDEARVLPCSSVANAVITSEKFEHSDEDDALHIVTLTLRPAARFPQKPVPETFRLFDATFDNTFN